MKISKKLYLVVSIIVCLNILFSGFIFNGTDAAEDVQGKYVLNIVLDGLSDKLFEDVKKEGAMTPNIDMLIENGTRLRQLNTTVPSYGGAQAGLVTGAYPMTNNFLYRYYDKKTNQILSEVADTQDVAAETIFEAIEEQKPDLKTLVLGMHADKISLDGRGIYKEGDPNHKLIEYSRGDNLISFVSGEQPIGDEILDSLNGSSEAVPNYILAYSNDIKMGCWNGCKDYISTSKTIIEQIDTKLGEIIDSLKKNSLYDDTIIIINSLSSIYEIDEKINGASMASDITQNTGVSIEWNGGGEVKDKKAVLVKTYIMKYGQLSFTEQATQEDIDAVITYLEDNNTEYGKLVKRLYRPEEINAPAEFADYIICPQDKYTFAAPARGMFRTDNLDEMYQFGIVSGNGVIKNREVREASIIDIPTNICEILGIDPPEDNEGETWDIFKFEWPTFEIELEGDKDSEGYYITPVRVSIEARKDIRTILYDIGDGYTEYKKPFHVNKDCHLKVKAIDSAGNSVQRDHKIEFIRLIDDISLEGDWEQKDSSYYTEQEDMQVKGKLLNEEENITIKINDREIDMDDLTNFSAQVQLKEGLNTITVEALSNGIGNVQVLNLYRLYDPQVTNIEDGMTVYEDSIDVDGYAVPGCELRINSEEVDVDDEGHFRTQVSLKEGKNVIDLSYQVGKFIRETSIVVNYIAEDPNVELSVTNFNNKEVVRESCVLLEGRADKKCKIKVDGKYVELKDDNSFSTNVELKDGVNIINLEAEYLGVRTTKDFKLVKIDEDDIYVVYINWDGFARYYYDIANDNGAKTPVLNALAKEGVFFDQAYTGIPAITNAMQPAIVSGAWPETTGNCYRYYDREKNLVVQYARENNAETIAEAVVRQGLNAASIHQYVLENRGTFRGDNENPYITVQGSETSYAERFDLAIDFIKGEPIQQGSLVLEFDELPRFLALYMDDLDGLGHNEVTSYGVPVVNTEKERIEKVVKRLEEMDSKLGEFVEACKKRGIYENMAFVLTTDHGMSPLGQQEAGDDQCSYSKLPDAVSILENLGYKVEVLAPGGIAKADTDIVIVTVGLELQLSLLRDYTQEDVEEIITAFENEPYVGEILTEDQLMARGTPESFADMVISPKPPYHFKTSSRKYVARGQHDSLDPTSQQVFSMMWGKGVKQNYIYDEDVYIIDFARTMAELLGIDGPKDATGQLLTDVLHDLEVPQDPEDPKDPGVPEDPEDPEGPEEPIEHEDPPIQPPTEPIDPVIPVIPVKPKDTSARVDRLKLPKTGSADSAKYIWGGIVLLIVGVLLYVFNRKKDEQK